jgi:hypothetical protein
VTELISCLILTDLIGFLGDISYFRADRIDIGSGGLVVKIERLFLLSHCDDEVFLIPFFLQPDTENTVVFFSTQPNFDGNERVRMNEAISVNRFLNRFQKLETVFLIPEVRDGKIHEDFNVSQLSFLEEVIHRVKPDEIVTLAYEGGHQDHDTVELVSNILSQAHKIKLKTCPAYSSVRFSRNFFSVMKAEDPRERVRIKRLLNLWVALRIIFIYKSQFKTWVGLAPFILIRYAFSSFWVTPVGSPSGPKLVDRCFYEFRGRADQDDVLSHLNRISSFAKNKG